MGESSATTQAGGSAGAEGVVGGGRAEDESARISPTNAELRGESMERFKSAKIFQRLDLTSPGPYSREEYKKKYLWMIVYHLVYKMMPRRSRKTRVRILRAFGATIDDTVILRPSAVIWHPWLLTMGANSCLADGVTIYNLGPVFIGEHTVISQNTYVCAGSHDYTQPNLPLTRPTIRIGSGVWVCASAFIGPGVTIGDNAIVGAASVVTKDVQANMIVSGNPAKVVKERTMAKIDPNSGSTSERSETLAQEPTHEHS